MVDSPSGRVPVKAPRWELADIESYCGGNSSSVAPLMVWGTWVYIEGRSTLVDARGAHETGGAPYRGGAASYLVGASAAS